MFDISLCVLQGGDSGRGTVEADHYMAMARETIGQLKACALDLRQMGQPNDSVVRRLDTL